MGRDEYMQLFEPFLTTAFKYYNENCSEFEFVEFFELFKASN